MAKIEKSPLRLDVFHKLSANLCTAQVASSDTARSIMICNPCAWLAHRKMMATAPLSDLESRQNGKAQQQVIRCSDDAFARALLELQVTRQKIQWLRRCDAFLIGPKAEPPYLRTLSGHHGEWTWKPPKIQKTNQNLEREPYQTMIKWSKAPSATGWPPGMPKKTRTQHWQLSGLWQTHCWVSKPGRLQGQVGLQSSLLPDLAERLVAVHSDGLPKYSPPHPLPQSLGGPGEASSQGRQHCLPPGITQWLAKQSFSKKIQTKAHPNC